MSKNRCSNSDAIRFIEYRDEFETNNETMYGRWKYRDINEGDSGRYVVYSYGDHFPMYVYDSKTCQWYGNKDKYSRTTSCHQSKARPRAGVADWFDTETMKRIVEFGMVGLIEHKLEKAYA